MNFPVEAIGKRLKFKKDVYLHYRHPNSGYGYTLPAGKPSPVVTSYIKQGDARYYQLEGGKDFNYYVKDTGGEIVPETAPDESSIFSGAWYLVKDAVSNTVQFNTKQAGFVKEGFNKSISDLGTDLFNIAGAVKPILYGVLALLALIAIIKISD